VNATAAMAIIRQHQDTIAQLPALVPGIVDFARRLGDCLEQGGTVLWMGNGGSAGDAQHLSAELVGRFQRERRGLRSLALSTDTSLMTAVANDYGYHRIFARQIETLARPHDVVVAISTSGNSRNVLEGVASARTARASVVALTGQGGGKLANCSDLLIAIPSVITARVQEAHILIGHLVCELLDERFAPAPASDVVKAPAGMNPERP
jgi:D-sedoheptulose 7-phosphate isomerase